MSVYRLVCRCECLREKGPEETWSRAWGGLRDGRNRWGRCERWYVLVGDRKQRSGEVSVKVEVERVGWSLSVWARGEDESESGAQRGEEERQERGGEREGNKEGGGKDAAESRSWRRETEWRQRESCERERDGRWRTIKVTGGQMWQRGEDEWGLSWLWKRTVHLSLWFTVHPSAHQSLCLLFNFLTLVSLLLFLSPSSHQLRQRELSESAVKTC